MSAFARGHASEARTLLEEADAADPATTPPLLTSPLLRSIAHSLAAIAQAVVDLEEFR